MPDNSQYLDRFLDYLSAEKNASKYTLRDYKIAVAAFLVFLADRKIGLLGQVDRHVWRDYSGLLARHYPSKASVACKQSAIRSFFNYLHREEILAANPLKKAPSPKQDWRLPSFLTIDETVKLLESPDLSRPEGLRDRALLEMLYASGIRVSELVGLDLEQLNMNTGEIRVWGKGAKERVVLVGEPAARALEVYLKRGRPQLLNERGSRAVFLNRYGARLPARRVEKILDKYARFIGKKVHPHMLRHTFATHLLDGGADLRVVQELLGHARLSSTQVYTHVTKSQARKVYLAAHPMARKGADADR